MKSTNGPGRAVGLLLGAVVGGFAVRGVLAARRRWFRSPGEPRS